MQTQSEVETLEEETPENPEELQEERIYDPSDPDQRRALVERLQEKMIADPDFSAKILAEVWVMLYGFEEAVSEFRNLGPGEFLKMLTGKGRRKK